MHRIREPCRAPVISPLLEKIKKWNKGVVKSSSDYTIKIMLFQNLVNYPDPIFSNGTLYFLLQSKLYFIVNTAVYEF